jgi:hypothetical protein
MGLYHNIRRPSTGEVKTVPWGELPAGWKPVNGIPFEQAEEKPHPVGNAEKFEFNGKEYKTEAAMKAAMTKAAKKEEVEEEVEEVEEVKEEE